MINKEFGKDTSSWLILGIIIGIVIYKLYAYVVGNIDYEIAATDGPKEEVAVDNLKMVLVVRSDLKMGKGKIGAQ